jgi:DNA processing protein
MRVGGGDDSFPVSLKNSKGSPKVIYCLGNLELLNQPAVAVVGSRQMSEYGKNAVNSLVPDLVNKGLVIVSGMALGVDAWAHEVCLNCGGKTVAVLASGVDLPTPKTNELLYRRILENGGLVVSEYPNGSWPSKSKFLERDRIIAGLSLGVLVIEGRERSGTRVIARLAAEMGREVWAVPGRIDEANSWTPNYLIKNGATLVEKAEDIWQTLRM